MTETKRSAYAATLLRVTLGGLFLAHAGLKLFVFTPAGAAAFFESIGVPGFVAYATIIAEIAAGLTLVAGVQTRVAALGIIPVLLGAIATVHAGNGFFFNNPNGGWEYPAFWVVALIVQALLGDGALALGPVLARSLGRRGTGPVPAGAAE